MPKLLNTLIVLPYDPNWKTEFERIRDYLMEQIGDLVLEIKHIGSTSVPGLCAKPIIDIVAVMESYDMFPEIVTRLEKVGFQHEGDCGIKDREAFRRLIPDDFMDYHFYVCPKDSEELSRWMIFLNALRENKKLADVTDLDNTLLRRDKTISEYTVRVFQRMRERGALIAFATARDFRFVTEHISPLFGIVPDIIIADNGALARYKGSDVYKKLIPIEVANTLLKRFELVRCVSTEKAYFLSCDYSNDHWSIRKKDTIITDFSSDLKDEALYVDGNTGNTSAHLTTGVPEVRAVTYSDVNLVTIVHREATKLNALKAVRNALGIEANDIAVFGDDYSDVEVLSNYTNSVAVANAIDKAKAAANYICGDCDNDGVAKWLEENVL